MLYFHYPPLLPPIRFPSIKETSILFNNIGIILHFSKNLKIIIKKLFPHLCPTYSPLFIFFIFFFIFPSSYLLDFLSFLCYTLSIINQKGSLILSSSTHASRSSFRITTHASTRLDERINPSTFSLPQSTSYSSKTFQTLAHAAKYNGFSITSLDPSNASFYNLTPEIIHYIKSRYMPKTSSGRNYFYRGYIYIFRGHKARTLITAFPLTVPETDQRPFSRLVASQLEELYPNR